MVYISGGFILINAFIVQKYCQCNWIKMAMFILHRCTECSGTNLFTYGLTALS